MPRRLACALALAACQPASGDRPRGAADPAILQGALWYWQEGPGAGRVCLDPRVLPTAATREARPLWADSVLVALLRDTLVALDTTAAPLPRGAYRACAPTRGGLASGWGCLRDAPTLPPCR